MTHGTEATPRPLREGETLPRRIWRIAIVTIVLLCLLLDLILVLWRIRWQYFVSVPVLQFVAIVWGLLTGGITVAATLVRVGQAVVRAVRGHATRSSRKFSIDDTIRTVVQFGGKVLNPPPRSLFALTLLLVIAYFLIKSRPLESQPTSSSVVVVSKGSEKFIYVAVSDRGEVQLTRASDLAGTHTRIPIGTGGNSEERGRPEQLLAIKHDQSNWIFVTDTKSNKIHVIDGDYVVGSFSTGLIPRSMAVTPDKRKLFVSNEQPIPSGTIQVFDIRGPDPNRYVPTDTIKNITCPEGLALSPGGDTLYVATQCGGDKDPIFVISTATNKIEASIPNLAVGSRIVVSADGSRIYVSRGNFPCEMGDGGRGSPLSIVDSQSKKILNTVCLQTSVGPLAISRDAGGQYLFVGNGERLSVFDRKSLDTSDKSLNEIPLGGGVSGIGVADDNSVYAFVPVVSNDPDKKPLLFLYNPQGLK